MDEEERNHCCLAILLTRVGAQTLRQHFIRKWDGFGRFMLWTDCGRNGKDLLTKFKPLPYEKAKVKSGDTTRWDVSLLVKALLNTRPPFVTSKGLVKSLKCLRDTRNTVCHTPDGKIATADFKKLWNAVCNALGVFGATPEDFKKVKRDVKLPLNELTSLMKQCAKQDDKILGVLNTTIIRLETLVQGQLDMKEGQEEIKKMIKKMEVITRHQKLEQGQQEIKEGQDLEEIKERLKKIELDQTPFSTRQVQLSTEDVQLRSKYLKTSAKRQTEFQPKLISSHSIASARTDEIFTNLIVQHGRKSLPKGASRREQLLEYNKPSGTLIERSQDIFIPKQKGKTHPQSILVTGKPGIGKSLFCQKLVRDWADDVLFEDEHQTKTHGFDFVYLLPFRQLNLIDYEQLTLREVLNRCSLVDERSNIDEQLFEYMSEHQEKVLFILDGYDEYKHRESITTNRVEQKYESNPRIALPVAALLSKLLKGKIFGEAVVMVTSRPTESNELGGMNFDALVEINGFSPQQVEEFIGKYFQSNSQMKDDVLGHVMENEDLISLAHVPMFCFLMCWCMEWDIEFNTDRDFPVNITEMYSNVLETFELKHHSKSQYRTGQIPEKYNLPEVVKSTLEKLSKLAVETMKTNKFNFEEEELTNIGLTSAEIEDLKLSGLLTSGPGLRTSATTITRYYCFTHLTLHEYFTARWYVDNGKVPSLEGINSKSSLQFFSGLSAKAENGEDLMEQLLLRISGGRQLDGDNMRLLLVRLLYEYGDKNFGVKMIERYFFRLLFCSQKGVVFLSRIVLTSRSSATEHFKILIYFLHLLNLFCQTHHEYLVQNVPTDENMVYMLYLPVWVLDVTITNIKLVFKALTSSFSPITSLQFTVTLQESLDILCDTLPSTKINNLEIRFQNVVDLDNLRKALLDTNCQVKNLIFLNKANIHNDLMLSKLKDFSEETLKSKSDISIKIKATDSLSDLIDDICLKNK